MRIKDTLVLGTTQGLALVRDNVVVPVPGLVTPVHSLQQVTSLQLLVLATGQDHGPTSQLVTADSRSILSGSSPVDPQPIPDITRCHIFSCTENNQVIEDRKYIIHFLILINQSIKISQK